MAAPTVGDGFGLSIAAAGDINGDGIDDLIIGGPTTNGTVGAAYVVFGRASLGAGIDLFAIAAGTGGFLIEGPAIGAHLGLSVAGAGDVNGDGFADLIVSGDPLVWPTAYVVFGKAGPFAGSLDLTAIAGGTGGSGILIDPATGPDAVSALGDIDGDGLADLIVADYLGDVVGTGAGSAIVVRGSAAGYP